MDQRRRTLRFGEKLVGMGEDLRLSDANEMIMYENGEDAMKLLMRHM